MKIYKWVLVPFVLILSVFSYSQAPTTFTLRNIPLSNGWRISGTITTDGTVGTLTAANVLDWNVVVTQTTDFNWTEKDSTNLNTFGVFSDGKKISVATSPDGIQDGGAINFSRGGGGGQIATSAIIADFTQLSRNMGYPGGLAGWQDEIWGLNFVGLNQRNHTKYRAALVVSGQPNVFRVVVPIISNTMSMFGTMTTDGTIGSLLPQNIIAWKITARNQTVTNYTKANSTVLSSLGVTSDGALVKVDHAGGQLTFGIGGARPTFVAIDFTDPSYPDGIAFYYMGNFGVMGQKAPLVGPNAKIYVVAKKP